MADKDTQLDLKKRARRRLVGAATLATAAAILLPLVMEQEPRPVGQDIQIRIPSQDTEPKKPDITAAKEVPATAVSEPVMHPAIPSPAKPDQENPAVDATAVNVPDKAGKKSVEKAPEKPVQKAEIKRDKPEPKADTKTLIQGEQARAQAILEGGEQFVVQLGAFKDPANARKIREKVKAEGYNSYTEVLSTSDGSATRVRAGPFSSREAAERACEKLKRLGLDGVVAAKS